MQPFTQRVVETIKSIPEGKVATYGQIAEMAGSRRAARRVVWVLHAMSEAHGLPWHRVVSASGEIALRDDEARMMQTMLLEHEGVEVDDRGRIDLDRYRYRPGDAD